MTMPNLTRITAQDAEAEPPEWRTKTMITQVSYARLYNTGNYENVRFEATASVGDNNSALAFDEVVAAVHEGYAQWLADREAEAAERKAEVERMRAAKNDEPLF